MGVAIDPLTDVMVDPMTDPVGYDSDTRTHTVYSEDFALLGLRAYTVRASLAEYPSVTTSDPDSEAIIEFLDPCPDPEEVTAVPQTSPAAYPYLRADRPRAEFFLDPYFVEPHVCDFVYSCEVISGPPGSSLTLCDIIDGDTHSVFDPITGNYYFESIDMANYLPGDYTFKITGTVGSKSAFETFTLTLVDPCPTAILTIVNPAVFVDQTYILRDP